MTRTRDNVGNDDFRKIPDALCFFVVFRTKDGIRTMRQTNIADTAHAIAVLDELNTLSAELTTWLARRFDVPTVERVDFNDNFGE